MKKAHRSSVVGAVLSSALSFFGLGLAACGAPAEAASQEESSASTAESELARPEPLTVVCTSDCSAAGGVSISETCTTCSATNSSVTCNGVTTECAPAVATCTQPREPVTKCSVGWHWCGCPEANSPYPREWVCGLCR